MLRLMLLVALALTLAACSRAVRVNQPNPSIVAADAYGRVFDAAVASLRRQGWVVDRQDYRFGEITTQPLTAPTMLEVWHGSNTTFGQAADSTLNHQRRIVRVTLRPDAESARQEPRVPVEAVTYTGVEAAVRDIDDAIDHGEAAVATVFDRYFLGVEVTIERQQRPTRRLTGSTAGRSVFASLREVPLEWQPRGITAQYWLPEGRDLALEQRILQDILVGVGEE